MVWQPINIYGPLQTICFAKGKQTDFFEAFLTCWPDDDQQTFQPRPLARIWPIFIVKIVSTRKMCHTGIYWQGWFSQTMVVSAAGTFIGHSLNLMPSFSCWSWLRITDTCEFDCGPLSHCQLLSLHRESSSQKISNDTKRQVAFWKSHSFKGNWCPGHVVCCGVLADTMHMHPVNCSLVAPLREQLALKIKALREFSISGYPNCGLRTTWALLRSVGTTAVIRKCVFG